MPPTLSRRTVLAGAAAIGAGLAVGSASPGRAALAAEQQFDAVVIGCGAAGMTAALRLARRGVSVLVVEKAPTFGGSAARSGAGIWIPNNDVILAAGVPDTPASAAAYLAAVVDGDVPTAKQQAFLDNGPRMISFVQANSPLRFRYMADYPDYYPELPGGMPQGRSIEPDLFDGKLLGPELANLNPAYMPTPPGLTVFTTDYKWLTLALVNLHGTAVAAECAARYAAAVLRGQTPLTMGQALAGALRAGLATAGVPVWLNTPFQDFQFDAQGRVTGVVVSRDGSPTVIQARRGVIVAAGGFEHNLAMRLAYQRKPIGTDWTVGAAANTGDGIQAGLRAGAATDFLDDAWWGPAIPLPGEPYFCLAERTLPGCILVNSAGSRFVNEAAPYGDVVHVMYDKNGATPDIPAWLVFDQNYRNRYLFRDVPPLLPFPDSWYDAGAVFRNPTLGGLAREIGVPADALCATVARFNRYALAGSDPDFHRGDSAYDHYYTDPAVRPNSCLAPLWLPPFYACKIVPGDLGTKGGLRTDARSRVLRTDGTVVAGLYAAGNSSAAVMGHSYAGAGATIGPAMTFGYIAANDIADHP
ncbi:3-oxosteroid 1-dehydrogenase [Krasilnikovia cinnamomea]|uniref:3-oxosteroid 1-dehydrogenase n=1 Tax=Krasilnikovia cinnamomea TaxID=349313 RepID=A0A4Q7ZT45_9ACTN|nr:3-oxosteroid 1-dehydrogenase [Krasilnikovia cinnamomea]RZU53675.1 3-oxosteroid 1-dehydrogenase [Krasilnikovia cinnamomea]